MLIYNDNLFKIQCPTIFGQGICGKTDDERQLLLLKRNCLENKTIERPVQQGFRNTSLQIEEMIVF